MSKNIFLHAKSGLFIFILLFSHSFFAMIPISYSDFKNLNKDAPSKIFDAILNENVEEISNILYSPNNNGINFEQLKDENGYTPILWALLIKKPSALDCLLLSGKVNIEKEPTNKSLIEIACENDDPESLKILLKYFNEIESGPFDEIVIEKATKAKRNSEQLLSLLEKSLQSRLYNKKEKLKSMGEKDCKNIMAKAKEVIL